MREHFGLRINGVDFTFRADNLGQWQREVSRACAHVRNRIPGAQGQRTEHLGRREPHSACRIF
jgi:hypothetical protein